jgi:hypothetical protein
LNSTEPLRANEDVFDRAHLSSFPKSQGLDQSKRFHCFKTSSSVLLTLAIPEESISREEEIQLLRDPRALWTVLAINCPVPFTQNQKSAYDATPVAQFIRGVTSSLHTQAKNTELMYDALNDILKSHDSDNLFDDDKYTKSTAFHFGVRACNDIEASITSSLQYIRRMLITHITPICNNAHAYEKIGVEYWSNRMEEKIFALEQLQAVIATLRSQVQESVRIPDLIFE